MSYVPANENRDILLIVGLVISVGGLAALLLRGQGGDAAGDDDAALSAEARMLEPEPEVDAREFGDFSTAEPWAAS
jgi:hypothetical protein